MSELKKDIEELKYYINIDRSMRDDGVQSDFDDFCESHCHQIENIITAIETTNEKLDVLIKRLNDRITGTRWGMELRTVYNQLVEIQNDLNLEPVTKYNEYLATLDKEVIRLNKQQNRLEREFEKQISPTRREKLRKEIEDIQFRQTCFAEAKRMFMYGVENSEKGDVDEH